MNKAGCDCLSTGDISANDTGKPLLHTLQCHSIMAKKYVNSSQISPNKDHCGSANIWSLLKPTPTSFKCTGLRLLVVTKPALLKIQNVLHNTEPIHSMTMKISTMYFWFPEFEISFLWKRFPQGSGQTLNNSWGLDNSDDPWGIQFSKEKCSLSRI